MDPSPPGRPDRAPVVIVAILVPLLVTGIIWLIHTSAARPEGRIPTPSACELLGQNEVNAYLPGAAPDATGGDSCQWSRPIGGENDRGRLTVAVLPLPGDPPKVGDAERAYAARLRQAGASGTTITPLAVGDESFMACPAPTADDLGTCTTGTRVGNVVFGLEFTGYRHAGAPGPGPSVRALAAQAVQRLRTASPDDGPGPPGP
jgi:hypothetical protein